MKLSSPPCLFFWQNIDLRARAQDSSTDYVSYVSDSLEDHRWISASVLGKGRMRGRVPSLYNTLRQTLLASDPTGIPAPLSLSPPLQRLTIININVPRFPYMYVLVVSWHGSGQRKKPSQPSWYFTVQKGHLNLEGEKESKTLKLNTNKI